MTEITINKKEYIYRASGHAGYATVGNDIVCASISALTYVFLANLDELERKEEIERFDERIDECNGHVYIRVKTMPDTRKIDCLFDVISIGLRMLSSQYPNHLRVVFE